MCLLRGIVHCTTGHNPLRMQGKNRKGNTYYACGYRRSYFGTRVFGPERLEHFRAQASALTAELQSNGSAERDRAGDQLTEVERRIERQLAAIEAGVDPAVVGERIRALKAERQEIETLVSQLDRNNNSEHLDAEEGAEILDSIPDLSKALKEADPEMRRAVFEAFRLRVEIDRNSGLI